jgi:glycosyltransferase involved in cell wall biosynthesis
MQKERKHIALFMPTFQLGGGERTFVTLANGFVRFGYDVDFVVCWKRGIFLERLSPQIHVVEMERRVRGVLPSLVRYISRKQPDYFISGSDFPNYLSIIANCLIRQSKTRIIIAQHCFYDIESRHLGLHGRVSPWLMKHLYPKAYQVIAVSDAIRSFLINRGISENKITRIYNPIDRKELLLRSEEQPLTEIFTPMLVYIGRLTAVKNLKFLLDAYRKFIKMLDQSDCLVAKNLSSCLKPKLFLIGDGEQRQELEHYIFSQGLKDDVILIGQTNPFPYLKAAKLLLITSLSESFSLVVAEAINMGKTVVSTPTGGVSELLGNGKYGYLSKDFVDTDAFALLMKQALLNPISGSLLEERSKVFSLEYIVEQYQRLLS